MELPATSGAGASPAPVSAVLPDNSHQDAADFQAIFDAGEAEDNERPDLNNAGTDSEVEVIGDDPAAQPPEQAAEAEVPEGTEKPPEKEAKKPEETDGQSLEEFFKEHGETPFLNLKFKTKVDGKEEEATVADLIRDRQLASASYARMNEAAQARQQFTVEQTQVRQALGVQIKQTQELLKVAQDSLLQDYQSVNWNALRAENPAQYAALYTDFQARNANIQQTLSQVAQAERQNAQAADTQRQQALSLEHGRLLAARPEWRDPAKALAANQAITAMGRTLGFTDAELAGISDHRMLLGLHQLAQLSSQASERQAAIPKVLKRVRAAPKMAAPGTRQAVAPKGTSNPKLEEAWLAGGGRNDQLGAAVFERFV